MERRSHNHDLDPSCNEHPTGDCIIQEYVDRIERVEESEGLLARLSASGGRNIDLLKRVQDAGSDLVLVKELRDHWRASAQAAEKKVEAVEAKIKDAEDREDNINPKWLRAALDGVPNA